MFVMPSHRFSFVLETFLLVLLASFQQCASSHGEHHSTPQDDGGLYGACEITRCNSHAHGWPKIHGIVLFKQEYPRGKLKVRLKLTGFSDEGPQHPKVLDFHEYGDLSHKCKSTGDPYDPPGHPGDLGDFHPKKGKINKMIESDATLFGDYSLFGRALVVHEKHDHMGQDSPPHGSAGKRLGCCVVYVSSHDFWEKHSRPPPKRPRRKKCHRVVDPIPRPVSVDPVIPS